ADVGQQIFCDFQLQVFSRDCGNTLVWHHDLGNLVNMEDSGQDAGKLGYLKIRLGEPALPLPSPSMFLSSSFKADLLREEDSTLLPSCIGSQAESDDGNCRTSHGKDE
ncbi:hypothetical protein PIB30_052113, partial [Stylosanthes scabra]|nr:hypothetical protein [Stylosanthes scabra]